MNIVLSNYETEEPIFEIDDASSAQVSAYTNSDIIQIKGEDWEINGKVMNFDDNTLYIFIQIPTSWN